MRSRCFLSLGSNVGDRAGFLRAARAAIAGHPQIELLRASSVLENPAILLTDQGDFLNQILEIRTDLKPLGLLEFLQKLEGRLGRVRRFRYGPREIDLDILTYGDLVLTMATLTLPHPGIFDREFLHRLLAELGESVASLTAPGGRI
jgi:2-amino-4-hydroxy-6-hydroxymethyldihydropteridine diphosphokinase